MPNPNNNHRQAAMRALAALALQQQQRRGNRMPDINWDVDMLPVPPPAPVQHQPDDVFFRNQHLVGHVVIMDDVVEAPRAEFKKPAIFWGGSDVDPSLYARPKSAMCGGTNRHADEEEALRMQDRIDAGQPIIGICRGAQLLNVVNGGILVQHIDNHAIRGEHPCIINWNGEELKCGVSSTHHQMMVAHKDGIVIGKGPGGMGYHWNEVDTPYEYKYVTEVVYYPKTRSLCIQPHPEWMKQDSPFVRWINRFIKAEFGMGPLDFAEEELRFQQGE